MIAFLKQQRHLFIFVAILFTFHWFSKDISDPFQRPITGDAQGYYAYLPALFIYNDLDYTFMDEIAETRYHPNGMKDFVYDVEGEKVNKTFPGVAVLYAPFFFAAHACALIFGLDADGFSTIYQLFFDLALWTYFLFGLIFMRKLLEKWGFSSKIALFSTVLIAFGTNMFFYTVYDQSTTHIYNFFMINAMLLCFVKWKETKQFNWLIPTFFLLALIGITRPTNFLVFGLILIFFGQKETFSTLFRVIFSKNIWKIVIPTIAVLSIPFLIWKAQTGKWIVYSYGEEGFNFNDPYFFSFLFSYTKGWMTYTPIVLPILITALFILFKTQWKKATAITLFYLISIYIFSSWWCWYYGAGMSQRVMIDHYILLAFLLAVSLKFMWDKKWMLRSFVSILLLFGTLNIVQAYQIYNGIIKNGTTTKEGYWDAFLVLEKRARIYPEEHWVLESSGQFKCEKEELSIDQQNPFSLLSTAAVPELRPGSKFVLSFESFAEAEVEQTRAVMTIKEDQSDIEAYLPFHIAEFSDEKEWVKTEFIWEPLTTYQDTAYLYFWNASADETVKFRNIKFYHYYSDQYY